LDPVVVKPAAIDFGEAVKMRNIVTISTLIMVPDFV
jgi:hypothetical protein